jgi:hypothetical protein
VTAQRRRHVPGLGRRPRHPVSTAPLKNVVDDLNRKLLDGSATLTFQGRSGYLRSVAEALKLPVDSQLVLYFERQLQGRLVSPTNPRALFFNDRVALGGCGTPSCWKWPRYDETAGHGASTRWSRRPAERAASSSASSGASGCHMAGTPRACPGC